MVKLRKTIWILLISVVVILQTSCSQNLDNNVIFVSEDEEVSRVTVEPGSKIEIPTITKDDHVLQGWFLSYNEGLTFDEKWDFDNDVVDANITLYAKWKQVYFYIKVKDNDDNELLKSRQLVGSDLSNLDFDYDFEIEGYSFIGFDETVPETMPESDLILHPVYIPKIYTLRLTGFFDEIVYEQEIPFNTDLSEIGDLILDDVLGYAFTQWNPGFPSHMPAHDLTLESEFKFYENQILLDIDWHDLENAIVTDEYMILSDWQHDGLTGRVAVYSFETGRVRIIIPSDAHANMKFGITMDVESDYLVVGARTADGLGGSIYLYKFSDETYERKITSISDNYMFLGSNLLIEGNYIIGTSEIVEYSDSGDMTGRYHQIHIYKIDDVSYERIIIPESNDMFAQNSTIAVNEYDLVFGGLSMTIQHYKLNDESFLNELSPSDISEGSFGRQIEINNEYIISTYSYKEFWDHEEEYRVYIFDRIDFNSETYIEANFIPQNAISKTDAHIFVSIVDSEEIRQLLDLSSESTFYEMSDTYFYHFVGLDNGDWIVVNPKMFDSESSQVTIYDFEYDEYWTVQIDSPGLLVANSEYIYIINISSNGVVIIDEYLH